MPKPKRTRAPMGQRKSDVPAPVSQKGKPGHKGGNEPFAPTPEQRAIVTSLAVLGIPQHDMCKVVINPKTDRPIDKKTLELHFRQELDQSFLQTTARIGVDFMKKCTGANAVFDDKGRVVRKEVQSDTKAQMFFLNTRLSKAGWNPRLEITGKNGGAIPVDITGLSDDQLDQLVQRLSAGLSSTAAG